MADSVSSSENEEYFPCYDTMSKERNLSKVIENDDMRRITAEFTRLKDRCYLENAGSVLYPQNLLERVNEDLANNVYMNPHTDKYTKDCIEQIRYLILRHFNTDHSEYSIIFTSGTTQALKLVVESFQFAKDKYDVVNCGSFVYLRENHTSVLGLREIALDKNADVINISHDNFLKYIDPDHSSPSSIGTPSLGEKYKNEGNTLFVYPAQSNFNGFKYPLNGINNIKAGCLNKYIKKQLCKVNCNWYILLDSASYVSSNRLDLSLYKPDFVCLSFYKIFGYPTGLGAVIVKNSSAHVLSEKRYFGGGTVDIVLSGDDYHVKRQSLTERFEDGTQSFLAIIALKHCFDVMNEMIPKMPDHETMDVISQHTFFLAQDLYNQLIKLEHTNGSKAAVVYHDTDFSDISKQGGIVTFNLLRHDTSYIGYAEFQHIADLFEINVRTGCFCNSGSCQRHLRATDKEMKEMYKAGHKCGDDFDLINGRPTGAIRVSFAYYNTYEDVDKLMDMICRSFVATRYKIPKRRGYSLKHSKQKNQNSIQEPFYSPMISPIVKRLSREPSLQLNINIKNVVTLREMIIFPIKSCGAFKITKSWKIGKKGFKYDREWMIVKSNGVCLTQKQTPRMCLIRPTIDLRQKLITLHFPDKPEISMSLNKKNDSEKEVVLCQTKVCADTIRGIDCGDKVADWISEALEISYLRLIRQSDNDKRALKAKDQVNGEQKMLNLSNQAQFLLINIASIRWLSNHIQDPEFTEGIDELADRFRGNLVIDSDKELIETNWKSIIIGKQEFRVQGPCTRCQMVCINQKTGLKTVEPLRTISEMFSGKMRFGIYLSYIGAVDGSKDVVLKHNSKVKALFNDTGISR